MTKHEEMLEKQRTICTLITGSHLYGTNIETSDKDFVSILFPLPHEIFGFTRFETKDLGTKDKLESGKNSEKAIDHTGYEIRKFTKLALDGNPNILELLYAPENMFIFKKYGGLDDDTNIFLFNRLKEYSLSKNAIERFCSYAHSQRHKMIIKSENFHELSFGYNLLKKYTDKRILVEVLEDTNNYIPIELGNVASSTKPIFTRNKKHIHCGDLAMEAGIYISKAKNIIKERLDKAGNRKELILKSGYDSKFASHLIRLLYEGLMLLENKELKFPLPMKDIILEIKSGQWKIEKVIELSEKIEDEIRNKLETTSLPKTANYEYAEYHLISLLSSYFR